MMAVTSSVVLCEGFTSRIRDKSKKCERKIAIHKRQAGVGRTRTDRRRAGIQGRENKLGRGEEESQKITPESLDTREQGRSRALLR